MKLKTLLLILLSLCSYLSYAQLTVSGSVKDEKSGPMVGVTVSLENKTGSFKKATQSAADGSFSISGVPAGTNYKLAFSSVGYASQVIDTLVLAQGMPLSFNISMQPTALLSDEVVVVAYSTQKKVNLTGAVDQVSGKVFDNRSIPNVAQGLQGFIPNLNITMGDGKPTQSPTFNIRGNTSIGQGGNALVLIDGVEGQSCIA
jgi:hypothetical protein